ncbi:ATP-binding cassette domain-containing protein [Micromonospora sp. NPDC050397]|uniref:ABC transporter ATP-binding protein n=1 Tax=Micromonospora sp. NPDC050397 TaxID=3364279 RepID=UPI00384DAB3E
MSSSGRYIAADGLSMTYRVPVRESSLRAAIQSIWRRETRDIEALASVDLRVCPGESVALIGPNGAGKTTLMKILAGILKPTSGRVRVLGQDPFERRPDYLRRIALVRGSQPLGSAPELTLMDSLKYQRLVYDLSEQEFRTNVDELIELLGIDGLLNRQVRALSLGERMRAGLAMALLYRPAVLFFDEPTIGLDVSAAVQTRSFLKRYVAQTDATLLLTSHYMADVAELCPRVVLINRGRKLFDGSLVDLTSRFQGDKIINVWIPEGGTLPVEATLTNGHYALRVARDQVATVAGQILSNAEVLDLTVRDAPLDVVIDQIYRQSSLDSP